MTMHIISPAAAKRDECESCGANLKAIFEAEDIVTDSWSLWENDTQACKPTKAAAAAQAPMSLTDRPGVVALLENIKAGGNHADPRLFEAAMAALRELKAPANADPVN